jgi:thioesterase domain-containing protein
LRAASAFEFAADHSTGGSATGTGTTGALAAHAILPRVIDRSALCSELTMTWHREIPIVAAMGMVAERYDGESLTVRAPLEPNRNVHGTTFAGSLYSACVLTGWGGIWLALRERGQTGVIYATDSTIQYRKGVLGEVMCRCALDSVARAALDQLPAAGRASLELTCTIESNNKLAVNFTGRYVVHAKRA